jgi:1-acyl-sn-glycerol-3-phosphate acyltransferase
LIDRVRSVFLWWIGFLWLAPMMTAMTVAGLVVPPAKTQWLDRLYCRGQILLTGSRWRAVVHPEIRSDRCYLFVQNHVNVLDHAAMYNATPHFKQGVELAEHFRIPFYGWMMKRRGTIPIRRGDLDREELIGRMRQELASGRSILAFPEGTRSRTGRVGRFRRGMFYLARELGVPIVPTAGGGMDQVLRTGTWILRPGDITVYCEAPIETADLPRENVPELADRVRAIIAARVDAELEARRV